MTLKWIDSYVEGLKEYCYSDDVYDICDCLGISLVRLDPASSLLMGGKAMYIRDYFDAESIFVRNDLSRYYEKCIIAHELAHAVLHTEVFSAAFNPKLLNRGKLEKQADYFAVKLLSIDIDMVFYEGFTIEQVASAEDMPISIAEHASNYLL